MRAVIGSVVRRLSTTYPGRLIQAYLASQAGNYASGLAFTAFLSMFPLIVGLLAILGLVTSDPSVRSQFLNGALANFFPSDPHTQQTLADALDGVRRNSGLFGAIGIAGFLWSGSSLFTTMEYALGRMLGSGQRDFLRQRGMALVMTLLFAVSVAVTIGLNSSLALLGSVPHVQPLLGLLVWMLFMAAVYRFVPNRTYRLRQMWPGVVLAATLMEALSLVWTPFAALSHNFSTYGTTFALFFLLASWLYFLSQFILLGAVAIRMHAGAPAVPGLLATPQPTPLETEATHAADRFRHSSSAAAA